MQLLEPLAQGRIPGPAQLLSLSSFIKLFNSHCRGNRAKTSNRYGPGYPFAISEQGVPTGHHVGSQLWCQDMSHSSVAAKLRCPSPPILQLVPQSNPL